jgi:hypothetical protein
MLSNAVQNQRSGIAECRSVVAALRARDEAMTLHEPVGQSPDGCRLQPATREPVNIWPMSEGTRIVSERISRAELTVLAEERFGDMVKAVIDVGRRIMAVGGELHSDQEAQLLEDGSRQSDLWGINLYPAEAGEEFIEFDSMINVRPSVGNRSRSVEDPALRRRLTEIVHSLVTD